MALELTSAPWLLGLGLVPLVRWLHRFTGTGRIVTVGALFLWPRDEGAGARHLRRRPPPVWRLRAAIVALVCLALAGPVWKGTAPAPLVVWFDTSISMHASEDGPTRLALAASDLAAAIDDGGYEKVTVRSPSDPARTLDLSTTGTDSADPVSAVVRWAAGAPSEPRAPVAALARADTEHWLVTDGVSPAIDAWLSDWPTAKVFYVGSADRNASISRVALRRSVTDGGGYTGIVVVRNASPAAAVRELRLSADDQPLGNWSLDLAAGESRRVTFALGEALPGRIDAGLTPRDALAADDALTLETKPLAPVAWHATGACPPGLRTALRAHPGLSAVAADGDFAVHCGQSAPASDGPRLVVDVRDVGEPVVGPLVWRDRPDTLTGIVHVAPNAAEGRVLATVNGQPAVVLENREPRTVSFTPATAMTAGAAFPPDLVAGLVDGLLAGPVLDPVAVAQSAGPADIAPRPGATMSPTERRPGASSAATSLVPVFALLALLLVLTDLWLVGRASSSLAIRSAAVPS